MLGPEPGRLGTPRIVGIAMAGIDIRAWYALAQAQGVPLVSHLFRWNEEAVRRWALP